MFEHGTRLGALSTLSRAGAGRAINQRGCHTGPSSQSPGLRTKTKHLLPREDLVIFGVVIAIIAFAAQVVGNAGYDMPAGQWFLSNVRLYLLICGLVLLGETIVRLLIDRPLSPIRYILSRGFANLLTRRILTTTPVLAVALLMPAFSAVKSSIGRINPFHWDAMFIALDERIHGTDPWLLLHPLMGHPAITYFASSLYHACFS